MKFKKLVKALEFHLCKCKKLFQCGESLFVIFVICKQCRLSSFKIPLIKICTVFHTTETREGSMKLYINTSSPTMVQRSPWLLTMPRHLPCCPGCSPSWHIVGLRTPDLCWRHTPSWSGHRPCWCPQSDRSCTTNNKYRTKDKIHIFMSILPITSLIPMF